MKRLADESMHLVVPEQIMNESVPLIQAVETGGTIRKKKSLMTRCPKKEVEARTRFELVCKDLQSSG